MESSANSPTTLTNAQRAKIERSRQRALLRKQARSSSRPYPEQKQNKTPSLPEGAVRLPGRIIDTGAGFLLDESDEEKEEKEQTIIKEPGPILEGSLLVCLECEQNFQDSSLYKQFEHSVCDGCRDEEKHVLITKTEAKDRYLLKDADLDRREPVLKFLVRKNPHNPRWGDMKLYLKLQIEQKALKIWGSMEKIDEEQEVRIENREKAKLKKFDKNVKELRKTVRTSLWTKDISTHQHTYGEESYNEDSDMYSKTCIECGQTLSYEKL